MKIVVLGNGFDRANGLPTSYNQFFIYKSNKYQEFYDKLENSLNVKFPVRNFKDERDLIRIKHNYKEEFARKLYNELEVIDNFFNNLVYDIKLNKLCFWDIYFWFLEYYSKRSDKKLWNNVEDDILNFITLSKNKSIYSLDYINEKYLNFDINNLNEDLISNFEDILYSTTKWDKIVFLLKKFSDVVAIEVDYLLEQLTLFEESFKNYINLIMKEIVYPKEILGNQRTYKDNFLKLIQSKEENEFFLLNFNYTSFSWADSHNIRKNTEDKNIYFFSRDKVKHKIIETNVHGNCKDIVIFGIDQSTLSGNSPLYIFTKTYRKINESEKLVTNPLPRKNEIDEIIFYGHSLSKADYSYFQSIFDYFDIYHSSIILTFKFSYYGEESDFKVIKSSQLISVTSLIKSYGSSMDNDKLGNNLIHKLLLENRLNVSNVVLEEINIDKFEEKYLMKI